MRNKTWREIATVKRVCRYLSSRQRYDLGMSWLNQLSSEWPIGDRISIWP